MARLQSTADAGAAGCAIISTFSPSSGGAAAVHTPGTGDDEDVDDDEAELRAYLSSSSSCLPGCSPSHISIVVSQDSPMSSSTNTITPGNKTVTAQISSSRDMSFRKNSSETRDDFEEDSRRSRPQHDKDNKLGLDCEQSVNMLDVKGGDMAGKNIEMEVSLYWDGDQAGADLDLDRMQPQKVVMQVCLCVIM